MIKLTYEQINSQSLNEGLQALSKEKNFPSFQSSYNVSKIVRKIEKEQKLARELYHGFLKDFVVVDEKGVPQFKKDAPYGEFDFLEGKKDEFEKKVKDFMTVEVEIHAKPITADDLCSIKLAPHLINAIEPILDLSAFETSEPQKTS